MAPIHRLATTIQRTRRSNYPQALSTLPWPLHSTPEHSVTVRSFAKNARRQTNNRWDSADRVAAYRQGENARRQTYRQPHSADRIAVYQQGDVSSKRSSAKLCSGCGCPILGGISARVKAPPKEKPTHYLDTSSQDTGIFCDRCKALQNANIWKAYDALRDVEPGVFLNQLKHVVQQRRFGLAILVLDATDSEHSNIRSLRHIIGKIPLIMVWNKVDLMPRFDYRDQRRLEQANSKTLPRSVASFAVSATRGDGTVDLAEYLMEHLEGRDVFVMGAANVGKSTLVKELSQLIAQSVDLEGNDKIADQRREQATSKLQVTSSNLPGTTLQALRIPCFASDGHALWDTPGLLSPRALQYTIFPSHLMEPLTRPGRIQVPSRENGKVGSLEPGYSLLIESTWMSSNEPQMDTECVLARIDLLEIDHHPDYKAQRDIYIQAFLHPSLRLRAVPTCDAPDMATIAPWHIARIEEKIQEATGRQDIGLKDEYSVPLRAYVHPQNPKGEFRPSRREQSYNGKYFMDLVFASLGWVAMTNEACFTIRPHCVQGSIFSKRKSIYEANMLPMNDLDYLHKTESLQDSKRRIYKASLSGRHTKGKFGPRNRQDEFYGDDERH